MPEPETRAFPEVEGWFSEGPEPRLLGLRDPRTNTYFFPRITAVSRPPGSDGGELEDVELSRTGKLWSYTTNHYPAPEPYVARDPFVPYTVAAVELVAEQMVVLGQLAEGVDPSELRVGMEMELTVEPLFEDEDGAHLIWKWRPARGERGATVPEPPERESRAPGGEG